MNSVSSVGATGFYIIYEIFASARIMLSTLFFLPPCSSVISFLWIHSKYYIFQDSEKKVV